MSKKAKSSKSSKLKKSLEEWELWKHIEQNQLPVENTLEALHDFEEAVVFEPAGGWGK